MAHSWDAVLSSPAMNTVEELTVDISNIDQFNQLFEAPNLTSFTSTRNESDYNDAHVSQMFSWTAKVVLQYI